MSFHATLEGLLGQPIDNICDGEFHDHNSNHCAHFVSHTIGLDFSYHCKSYKGGNGTPANLRVHEIFARCPKVGHWEDADLSRPRLVFVTKTDNVDVDAKTMVNIPQKHIGIFSNGQIYHYSNGGEKVIKQEPDDFLRTFDRIYTGAQSLFFGTFPESDLFLDIHLDSDDAPRGRTFDLVKDGRTWHARPDGNVADEFYVGVETSRAPYIGLMMRANDYYGPQYKASDYVDSYDHWANLLELTGYCESKNYFNQINTYDSAKFTFGFYQLAAHTARDNLILLFRELLKHPEANDYFPELAMINGRVYRVDEDGGQTDLEVAMNTGPNGRSQLQLFMNFLNAKLNSHDTQEVLQSARLIHWSNTEKSNRDTQVAVSADILQRKMTERYAGWYDLDGQADVICALIADIHHQGRGSVANVQNALMQNDPIEALITVNANYVTRANDLRTKLTEMIGSGQLGTHIYDAALNEFRVS